MYLLAKDVISRYCSTGGLLYFAQDCVKVSETNLDINHDLYASAIRKNQDHPIFMALEVSVCEPQNYV